MRSFKYLSIDTMKKFLLGFLLMGWGMQSQSLVQKWEGHFSYQYISAITSNENTLITAADNAIFLYDTQTHQRTTLTTIEGLTGESISSLHFDNTNNQLIVGYENGMLSVYSFDDASIYTDVSIYNKTSLSNSKKRINAFEVFDNQLIISCDFGISIYNPTKKEFGDTYYFGANGNPLAVRQTVVFEEYIYAATDVGIYRAFKNANNLISYTNWELITGGDWNGLTLFEEKLVATHKSNRSIYEFNGATFVKKITLPSVIKSIEAHSTQLVVATQNAIELINTDFTVAQTLSYNEQKYGCAIGKENYVYAGTEKDGLVKINSLATNDAEIISPEGPLSNFAFNITVIPNEIWVVYGDYSIYFNPFPEKREGFSHFKENTWVNVPYSDVLGASNLVHVNPHPKDSSKVYMGSFQSGLLYVEDDVPQVLYNQYNSGLESISFVDYSSIRIRSTYFDENGDLWVLTAFLEEGLKKLGADGSWTSYSIQTAVPDHTLISAYSNIVKDRNNTLFFGSSHNGIVGFTTQGGSPISKSIFGEENNFPHNGVRTVALDLDGYLWMGTTKGLRVIYDTASFFSEESLKVQEIIIDDQGNASELLYQQFITSIKVDGNNRKWVATADSGVFLFSANGQETLQHFTKENSPLPSNTVNAVELDPATGKVYFATAKGLISFQGKAFLPEETYSNVTVYPNPVRPGFHDDVTIRGLIENSHVKITDIEGNLVFEGQSDGGSILWNQEAFGRHKVASGVYLIFISDAEGTKTKIAKLMIIR